jgi:Cu(I)/Ag(I) efflux system membrane fusion protein
MGDLIMLRKTMAKGSALATLGLLTALVAGTSASAGEDCCPGETAADKPVAAAKSDCEKSCEGEKVSECEGKKASGCEGAKVAQGDCEGKKASECEGMKASGCEGAKVAQGECEGMKASECGGAKTADACASDKVCGAAKMLKPYFAIRTALAADSVESIAMASAKLAKCGTCAVDGADDTVNSAAKAYAAAAKPLHTAAAKGDMDATRKAFHDLSKAAIAFAEAAEKTGLDMGQVVLFTCPMSPPFGKWLQESDAIGNPYWGAKMLKCGKAVRTLATPAGEAKESAKADTPASAGGAGACCAGEGATAAAGAAAAPAAAQTEKKSCCEVGAAEGKACCEAKIAAGIAEDGCCDAEN